MRLSSPSPGPLLSLPSVWAENVNARGGIPIAGKNYTVELVVIDCGCPAANSSLEATKVANTTRDLVKGVYGRIDLIFPAYTSSYAESTFRSLNSAALKNFSVPVIGSFGESGVMRCAALPNLPSDCVARGAKVDPPPLILILPSPSLSRSQPPSGR